VLVLVRHASPYLPVPGGPDDYHRALTARGRAEAVALAERDQAPGRASLRMGEVGRRRAGADLVPAAATVPVLA
jgi:hypothetical protein